MSSDLDKMPTVKLLKQTVDAESEMVRLFDVVTKLTKERAELVEYISQKRNRCIELGYFTSTGQKWTDGYLAAINDILVIAKQGGDNGK